MPQTAVWGHIGNYTSLPPAPIQRNLTYQVTQAAHVFSYTPRGAIEAIRMGANREDVTAVNNTVDLAPIREKRRHSARRPGSSRHLRVIFIGALEESKRLSWAMQAAEEARREVAKLEFVVVGGGPLLGSLQRWASSRTWVTVKGPTFGAEVSDLLINADLLLNPGRVGLVATEALAAQVPIVTTDYAWHAPEFDYLEHDSNCLVVSEMSGPVGYAREVRQLLLQPDRVERLSVGCQASGSHLGIPEMAAAFVRGIERVVDPHR